MEQVLDAADDDQPFLEAQRDAELDLPGAAALSLSFGEDHERIGPLDVLSILAGQLLPRVVR